MKTLRIVPLGGLGEFGNNLMVYEFDGSSIIVDCGMMFPDAATLGVDALLPDLTYLLGREQDLLAVFLTHGHEDHIGALPFLLDKMNVPVYGAPLTLGFVAGKLDEFGMTSTSDLRNFRPRDVVEVGPFSVEAIHVTHSIVDSLALAIRTPIGSVIHTGDFKLDPSPVNGETTDLSTLSAYGDEGVLLLVSDSTNAVVPGHSRSESVVGSALEPLFRNSRGRIIITTFASHIHRIQQIIDLARRSNRRVQFVGRSMVDNIETAERLGWLRIPREVRAPAGRGSEDLAPEQTVILTTGTQGEPTSALSRMALNEHKTIEIGPGDTVVMSARTIPGNELAVSHLIDHLFHRGADVIYDEVPDVHVSGHACQEELRSLVALLRPRYFIPMHGTYRHLVRHGGLAESAGVVKENVFVITNGDIVELTSEQGRVIEERAPAGKVFVDRQYEEVADIVVRDRKHLAEDGFVIVVVALDLNTGVLAREPEVITRGLVHVDTSGAILQEVRELLQAAVAERSVDELRDPEGLQEKIRTLLKRYFRKKLGRRPMILPVIWEM